MSNRTPKNPHPHQDLIDVIALAWATVEDGRVPRGENGRPVSDHPPVEFLRRKLREATWIVEELKHLTRVTGRRERE